jgi:hypothetical protein
VIGKDSLGQVTSAVKYWSDGRAAAGEQFGNTFDNVRTSHANQYRKCAREKAIWRWKRLLGYVKGSVNDIVLFLNRLTNNSKRHA